MDLLTELLHRGEADPAVRHLVRVVERKFGLTDTERERIRFYEKYGFMSLGRFRGHERMFLPMKTADRPLEN